MNETRIQRKNIAHNELMSEIGLALKAGIHKNDNGKHYPRGCPGCRLEKAFKKWTHANHLTIKDIL